MISNIFNNHFVRKNKNILWTIGLALLGLILIFVSGFLYSAWKMPRPSHNRVYKLPVWAGVFWSLRYWTVQTNILVVVILIVFLAYKFRKNIELNAAEKRLMMLSTSYIVITGVVWTVFIFPTSIVTEFANGAFRGSLNNTQYAGWVLHKLSGPFLHIVVPIFTFKILVKDKRLSYIKNSNIKNPLLTDSIYFVIYPVAYLLMAMGIYFGANHAVYSFLDFRAMGYWTIAVIPMITLVMYGLFAFVRNQHMKRNYTIKTDFD